MNVLFHQSLFYNILDHFKVQNLHFEIVFLHFETIFIFLKYFLFHTLKIYSDRWIFPNHVLLVVVT